MASNGDFKVISGASAVEPIEPEGIADAMLLYKLYIPAYTFNTADIKPLADMLQLEEEIKKLINNLPVKEITNMLYIKYDISKKAIYDMCLKLKSNS